VTDREQRRAEIEARAHNARVAIPPRDEASRYNRLGPEARALVDDYDEIDLAGMLVTAKDELAALRTVARGYCPACGRGDAAPTVADWEEQKQRAGFYEAALARIQALIDAHPAGIDTALILEALDQTTPAAAEPREHCGHLAPTTLLTTRRTECVLRPGHSGSHADDRGCRWWHDPAAADEPARTTPNSEPPPVAS
jgi:hypothetical protein